MNLRKLCRRACLFLAGMNLLQPLRVALDSAEYIESRFQLPTEELGGFLATAHVKLTALSAVGAIAVSLYMMLVAAKMGFSHLNKLLTIVTSWTVLLLDLLVLITFCAGGKEGSYKSFMGCMMVSALVFGANETMILNVDPINIPYFLLGISFSAFQVLVYQIIFKRVVVPPLDVDLTTWTEKANYRMVVGQLVISLLISVLVVVMFSYSYGGKDLYNMIGISKITHFVLDNSSNHLYSNYKWNKKYKKYLNEQIVHRIKNLEYEIILKFNLKESYKITNIIQTDDDSKESKFKWKKRENEHRDGRNKDHRDSEDKERELEDRKDKDKHEKDEKEEKENEKKLDTRSSDSTVSEDTRERIDIPVNVKNLRYQNMHDGLEIYRHEVFKDVKLSRIHNKVMDIDLNLYHFKYADVYSKSNLTLINVITIQFSNTPNQEETPRDKGKHGFFKLPNLFNRKKAPHKQKQEEEEHEHTVGTVELAEGEAKEEEEGVYEMNYYFLILVDRMYQYKPQHDEWVHPVELLLELVDLYNHSLTTDGSKDKKNKKKNQHMLGFIKKDNEGKEVEEKDKEHHEEHEDKEKEHEHKEEEDKHEKDGEHEEHHHGQDRHERHHEDHSKEGHHDKHGQLTHKKMDLEKYEELRHKLIVLFLNNKLKYAIEGSFAPMLLGLLTLVALFASTPVMTLYEKLGPEMSSRFEVSARIMGVVPAVGVCLLCGTMEKYTLQATWRDSYRYFVSYGVYLVSCLVSYVIARNGYRQTEHGLLTLLIVVVLSYEVNIVLAFVSLPFQKSSKHDFLTHNHLDNNIKTNVQLVSFCVFLYHAIRLVYLSAFKYNVNRLFLLLFWVI